MKANYDQLTDTGKPGAMARRAKRQVVLEKRGRAKTGGAKNKADKHSRFSKYTRRMAQLLDIHPAEVFDILNVKRVPTARFNTLKSKLPSDFEQAVKGADIVPKSISWYPDGFAFEGDKREVFSSTAVSEGFMFIQNASSFLPVLAMQPGKEDHILDVCASPGGKATHIAALTDNQSNVWANDGIELRLPKLKEVQTTLGANFAAVTSIDGKYIDREIEKKFDRILLDAQCSGEGMIDLRDSKSEQHWSMGRIKKHHHLQVKMLRSAFKLLKPGGTLVYSTCTFAPEENEAPISVLLRDFEDARVEPITFDQPNTMPAVTSWNGEFYNPAVKGALRVMPNHYMEGFFVCRIRKLGANFTTHDINAVDLAAEGVKRTKIAQELSYETLM